MLDLRLGAQLEPPAGALQPPAEVGVLGRPDAFVEASHLVEGGPPHQQVRGHRTGEVGVGEMGLLVEEAPRRTVALGDGRAVGRRHHLPGQGAHLVRHRLGEERVEQPAGGPAIGVEEQNPVVAGALGAGVARVRGRALAARGHDLDRAVGADQAGVVGQDQLIVRHRVELEQGAQRLARGRGVPRERHHHGHGGAAHTGSPAGEAAARRTRPISKRSWCSSCGCANPVTYRTAGIARNTAARLRNPSAP